MNRSILQAMVSGPNKAPAPVVDATQRARRNREDWQTLSPVMRAKCLVLLSAMGMPLPAWAQALPAQGPAISLDAVLDARLDDHDARVQQQLDTLKQRLDLVEQTLPTLIQQHLDAQQHEAPHHHNNNDAAAQPAPAPPTLTLQPTQGNADAPLPQTDDGSTRYTVTANGWPAGHALTIWCQSQPDGQGNDRTTNTALGHATIALDGSASTTVTLQAIQPGKATLIADVHPANQPPDPDRDNIRVTHTLQRTANTPTNSNSNNTNNNAAGNTLLANLAAQHPLRRINIEQLPAIRSGTRLSNLIVDAGGGPGLTIPAGTSNVVLERVFVINAGGRKQPNGTWVFGSAGFVINAGSSNITLIDCGNFDSAGGPGHGRRMQGVFITRSSDITLTRFVAHNIHGLENKTAPTSGGPHDDHFSHGVYAIDIDGLTIDGFALIGGDGQVVKTVSSKPGGSSHINLRNILGVWNQMIASTGYTDTGNRLYGPESGNHVRQGMVTDYTLEHAALVEPDGWMATRGVNAAWGVWANGADPRTCRVAHVGRYQFDPSRFVAKLSSKSKPTDIVLKPLIEAPQNITIGEGVADQPERVLIADLDALVAKVRSSGYGEWCNVESLTRIPQPPR